MTVAVALHSDDLYERLGVDRTASVEDVKRAYRALLRSYPPERAPEEFKRIREAYETLSNPQSRSEYDARPDPLVERSIRAGMQAMKADDHATAAKHFKQALLQEPELAYVRNLLGLCFLYDGEPGKALEQFARLTVRPDAAAAWFSNAGYAFLRLKRFSEAERAFQEAIDRSEDDNPVDSILGLADVYLDQGDFTTAERVLLDAIKADGSVDFQDLRYFTKLLEANIRAGSLPRVGVVLKKIEGIATDQEKRTYVAWKLGVIAQQLIAAAAFRFATPVAQVAVSLQPSDHDYQALVELSLGLERNDFAAVEQLVRGHRSFAAGGWLEKLGRFVLGYVGENSTLAQMKPISSAPTLYTINGIGTALYGQRDEDARTKSYVATLYFVILFVPILPLACYRVIAKGGSSWSFLGKVPFGPRERWHLRIVIGLIIVAVLRSAFVTPPTTAYRAYGGLSAAPTAYAGGADVPRTDQSAYGLDRVGAMATYHGSVTNSGLPNSPGTLDIAIDSLTPRVRGYIHIGEPLAGSGEIYGEVRADTLILASVSTTGDTIVWLARLSNRQLTSGKYVITGGPYSRQGGEWEATLRSGDALVPDRGRVR